jgi:hypothetical protein
MACMSTAAKKGVMLDSGENEGRAVCICMMSGRHGMHDWKQVKGSGIGHNNNVMKSPDD